jgi:hypothetical protein
MPSLASKFGLGLFGDPLGLGLVGKFSFETKIINGLMLILMK